jgi:hypothetical protein
VRVGAFSKVMANLFRNDSSKMFQGQSTLSRKSIRDRLRI